MTSSGKWREIALKCARHAHEHLGEHLRGIDLATPSAKLYVYNNDPRPNEPWLRHRETEVFSALLDTFGCSVLGHSSFPPANGRREGFTTAMIVDAEIDSLREIRDLYECALRAVLSEWRGELKPVANPDCVIQPICGPAGSTLLGWSKYLGAKGLANTSQFRGDPLRTTRVCGFHRD
jgi:hypothetical protein